MIKTRWVNAQQNKNKIIYITKSYVKWTIAHVIILYLTESHANN